MGNYNALSNFVLHRLNQTLFYVGRYTAIVNTNQLLHTIFFTKIVKNCILWIKFIMLAFIMTTHAAFN